MFLSLLLWLDTQGFDQLGFIIDCGGDNYLFS